MLKKFWSQPVGIEAWYDAHMTSFRNVISIEHTASAVFVALAWFCCSEKEGILHITFSYKHKVVLYSNIFNTQSYILFEISASGLFLKCSCKIYSSVQKGSVVGINPNKGFLRYTFHSRGMQWSSWVNFDCLHRRLLKWASSFGRSIINFHILSQVALFRSIKTLWTTSICFAPKIYQAENGNRYSPWHDHPDMLWGRSTTLVVILGITALKTSVLGQEIESILLKIFWQ